jgi:hypothetical protein
MRFVIWRHNFPWFGLNYFRRRFGCGVAGVVLRGLSIYSAIAIILPILVITYLTHRTSWDVSKIPKRHVEQLSDLYLSTIETLAMAVDAKDQITHGHIRARSGLRSPNSRSVLE